MVSCVKCGRSRTKFTKSEGITFHRFPNNGEKQKSWISFVNNPNWTASKNSFLCSLHFTEDCFDRSSLLKVRLRDSALPTISITRMKYVRLYNPEESYIESKPSTSSVNELPIPSVLNQSEPSTPTCDPLELPCDKKLFTSEIEVPRTPPTTPSLKLEYDDTSSKVLLKRKLTEMYQMDFLKNKKIRLLQKKLCIQKKKIDSLNAVISQLKKENELISKFNYYSKASEDIMYNHNIIYSTDEINNEPYFNLDDHDYALNNTFSEEEVIYTAGFVAHKIKNRIKCEHCADVLFGTKENLFDSHLTFKNRSGLRYPHDDVIEICSQCEKLICQFGNVKISKELVSIRILAWLKNKIFFRSMPNHDDSSLLNHKLLLVRRIVDCYVTIRTHFIGKSCGPEERIRNYVNKTD